MFLILWFVGVTSGGNDIIFPSPIDLRPFDVPGRDSSTDTVASEGPPNNALRKSPCVAVGGGGGGIAKEWPAAISVHGCFGRKVFASDTNAAANVVEESLPSLRECMFTSCCFFAEFVLASGKVLAGIAVAVVFDASAEVCISGKARCDLAGIFRLLEVVPEAKFAIRGAFESAVFTSLSSLDLLIFAGT